MYGTSAPNEAASAARLPAADVVSNVEGVNSMRNPSATDETINARVDVVEVESVEGRCDDRSSAMRPSRLVTMTVIAETSAFAPAGHANVGVTACARSSDGGHTISEATMNLRMGNFI
jgi:hypothetical protein